MVAIVIHAPVEAFQSWLATAKRGDSFKYYRGFLAADRRDIAENKIKDCPIGKLAIAVCDAAKSGRVYLTQRKHGSSGDYSYIAQAPRRAA